MQSLFVRRLTPAHKEKETEPRLVRDIVEVTGDVVVPGASALILSNHRSFSDFYPIHTLALRADMLPYCKYFAKVRVFISIRRL